MIHELEAFLKAHGDVEAVEAFLTDPNGVARGKLLRTSELAALYRSGRPLPGSILSLDTTGMEVEQTGLVWDVGDADKVAWPVAGSLRRASWREPADEGARFVRRPCPIEGPASAPAVKARLDRSQERA